MSYSQKINCINTFIISLSVISVTLLHKEDNVYLRNILIQEPCHQVLFDINSSSWALVMLIST
jgi:hypothetical protein